MEEIDIKKEIVKKTIEKNNIRTSHTMHLILSLLTGGLWVIGWVFATSRNDSKVKKIESEIVELEMLCGLIK
jgi:cytochrome b561